MLELATYYLFLCYVRSSLPPTCFSLVVALWISGAYLFASNTYDGEPIRDNDPVNMVWNPGAVAWARSWSLFYTAYLLVDTASQLRTIPTVFLAHHVMALLAYASNVDTAFGAMVLYNVFVMEPSTVLVNLRFALKESNCDARILRAVDCVTVPVYLWLRCWAFPYRMYRCFYVVLPVLEPELRTSPKGLLLGRMTIFVSIVLNFYWSALILQKVPAMLRGVAKR